MCIFKFELLDLFKVQINNRKDNYGNFEKYATCTIPWLLILNDYFA